LGASIAPVSQLHQEVRELWTFPYVSRKHPEPQLFKPQQLFNIPALFFNKYNNQMLPFPSHHITSLNHAKR